MKRVQTEKKINKLKLNFGEICEKENERLKVEPPKDRASERSSLRKIEPPKDRAFERSSLRKIEPSEGANRFKRRTLPKVEPFRGFKPKRLFQISKEVSGGGLTCFLSSSLSNKNADG